MPPLWKTAQNLLKKVKIELLYDSVIPLLCIYQDKTRTLLKRYIHGNFPAGPVFKTSPSNVRSGSPVLD